MSVPSHWSEFDTFADAISAEAMAGLLRAEAVPVLVIADEPVPGLAAGFRLMVPPELRHRAVWIASQAQALSDAELDLLATGKLADGEAQSGD